MRETDLIRAAIKGRQNAVAPYSGFAVGAALLTKSGSVYIGCNMENGAYSPSLCAERVAFGSAVAAGERDFSAIAVIGNGADYCWPCGVCRQVMAEFCGDDFRVIAAKDETDFVSLTLGELLPHAFRFGK
ncbi:MAG: cytidine deaminase [Clostridia bacterium]